MAVEDFTTYTEVDLNSDLTVTSSKIDIDSLIKFYDSYVRKVLDEALTDFDFLFEVTVDEIDASGSGFFCGLGLHNDETNVSYSDADFDGEGVFAGITEVGSPIFGIEDFGADNTDFSGAISLSTKYYLTFSRSGSTLTLKIYSDSGRTTLVDTLTVTCTTDSLDVLDPLLNRGGVSFSQYLTGAIENLDLQSGAEATATPSLSEISILAQTATASAYVPEVSPDNHILHESRIEKYPVFESQIDKTLLVESPVK